MSMQTDDYFLLYYTKFHEYYCNARIRRWRSYKNFTSFS